GGRRRAAPGRHAPRPRRGRHAHRPGPAGEPRVQGDGVARAASPAREARRDRPRRRQLRDQLRRGGRRGSLSAGRRHSSDGGDVAKAVAEWAGCGRATGSDVKAFCSGPMHALMLAGAMVRGGLHDDVLVVAGGSLAKLGMKFQGHLKHAMPIVEDVLAGFAVHGSPRDGVSPVLGLEAMGGHEVASGSAPLAVVKALYSEPLGRVGLTLLDVDRFSLELHNPEATEPAGSGNVPLNNYRTLASLAVVEKLIAREGIDDFVRTRGMPGFSPT